jgi:uncharacterized protein YkwD
MRTVLEQELPYPAFQSQAALFFATEAVLHARDLGWIEREWGNLVAAAQTAASQGQMQQLASLVQSMHPVAVLRGWWWQWEQLLNWADQVVQATGDSLLQAWVLHERGTRAALLGDRLVAAEALQEAVRLRRNLGDSEGLAASRHNLKLFDLPFPAAVSSVPSPSWMRRTSRYIFFAGVIVLMLWRLGMFPPQLAGLSSIAGGGITVSPTASSTITPTTIPIPTSTDIPTQIPTSTTTPRPTATSTPLPTPLPTLTPTVTPLPTLTPTVTPLPTATPVPAPPPIDEGLERAVINVINQRRRERGCDPLAYSPELTAAARWHSYDMASRVFPQGTFDPDAHTGSNGSNRIIRAKQAGYVEAPGTRVRENLIAGSVSAADVVNGWMDNSIHEEQMFDCTYNDIGVGYVYDEDSQYRIYWTAMFGIGL